jgi:Sec-independent protein translocase protein TatA
MGDAARGINAFKKGLKEDKSDGDAPAAPDKVLNGDSGDAAPEAGKKDEVAKS